MTAAQITEVLSLARSTSIRAGRGDHEDGRTDVL
jgi:hypothetical protein